MQQLKINFKQPKYILPAILYLPLLGVGYLFIDLFNVEVKSAEDSSLKTTEYLNSDLPTAVVRDDLGNKRSNVEKTFGGIKDLTAVNNIENDRDSIRKKEDFDSRYTEKDIDLVGQQLDDDEARAKLKEMQEKLAENEKRGKNMSGNDFVQDLSEEEREKIRAMQRGNDINELEAALGLARKKGSQLAKDAAGVGDKADSLASPGSVSPSGNAPMASVTTAGVQGMADSGKKAVKAFDAEEQSVAVVKKVDVTSDYFNTLNANKKESHMIKAIVDEDIKAVDGSRVRLRLLDAIEVNGVTLEKGRYLYCIMSGFGSQRVHGNVGSVMIDDEIVKINLAIYDTDGLEGLYVPQSQFRETAKDIGSQALSGSMNVTDGLTTSTNFLQWGATAVQSAYQRASQALSKNIRKNKAKIKYGTQVYLLNAKDKKQNKNNASGGGSSSQSSSSFGGFRR